METDSTLRLVFTVTGIVLLSGISMVALIALFPQHAMRALRSVLKDEDNPGAFREAASPPQKVAHLAAGGRHGPDRSATSHELTMWMVRYLAQTVEGLAICIRSPLTHGKTIHLADISNQCAARIQRIIAEEGTLSGDPARVAVLAADAEWLIDCLMRCVDELSEMNLPIPSVEDLQTLARLCKSPLPRPGDSGSYARQLR